ncbi:hypothetical protein J437_LFUL001961 [Ladona fulva]|uniref:Uncharacterized protein n=1 Tax=Ladona fulva TaxID=123851 RepID=A0A8K0JX26_LADFU|nr:hypothetical protein J437_LFUL001961 [Ladona fulva]
MGLVSGGGWRSQTSTGKPGWNGAEAAAGCSFEQDPGRRCRKCGTCFASNGPQKLPKAPMRQYNLGSPFERIAIDIAGPFPETGQGNKYILVTVVHHHPLLYEVGGDICSRHIK